MSTFAAGQSLSFCAVVLLWRKRTTETDFNLTEISHLEETCGPVRCLTRSILQSKYLYFIRGICLYVFVSAEHLFIRVQPPCIFLHTLVSFSCVLLVNTAVIKCFTTSEDHRSASLLVSGDVRLVGYILCLQHAPS